jgi:hypothetical protein
MEKQKVKTKENADYKFTDLMIALVLNREHWR